MTSLDQKVLQAASGEKRCNPDELRKYFGTFAERVVLAILLENAEKASVLDHFPQVLQTLNQDYTHLTVKLSPSLLDQTQFTYIKAAQNLGIQATIVDEAKADSPFGVVVHTDKAENLTEVLFCHLYPEFIIQGKVQDNNPKQGFWAKLFGHK